MDVDIAQRKVFAITTLGVISAEGVSLRLPVASDCFLDADRRSVATDESLDLCRLCQYHLDPNRFVSNMCMA